MSTLCCVETQHKIPNESRLSIIQGSAGAQPLRISRSQAMEEFSLFMWWRVFEACSQTCLCWGVDSASPTNAPHTTVGALKLGNNIPTMQFSLEFSEIHRQIHIKCYYWLSVSGNSATMHYGILINMPYRFEVSNCVELAYINTWFGLRQNL